MAALHYYNEFDSKAAAWLRSLMAAGIIPEGEVDERSIADVSPDDLRGFAQCHFFAGIGGWPIALELAGWAADRPCWTGSCPCQPFSQAGKGKGEKDARDLWPDFFRLVGQRHPSVCFGEQVEGAITKHGWLDRVSLDLEGCGYAVGSAVLPAACVNSPHVRHRLFWVADSQESGLSGRVRGDRRREELASAGNGTGDGRIVVSGRNCDACGLVVANGPGSQSGRAATESNGHRRAALADGVARGVEYPTSDGWREGWSQSNGIDADAACPTCGMGDTISGGVRGGGSGEAGGTSQAMPGASGKREWLRPDSGATDCTSDGLGNAESARPQDGDPTGGLAPGGSGPAFEPSRLDGSNPWFACDLLPCRDGKYRRVESGSFPLVNGIPRNTRTIFARLRELGHSPKDARRIIREAKSNRPTRLRGYGNAIVPQVAAEFVRAFIETQTQEAR